MGLYTTSGDVVTAAAAHAEGLCPSSCDRCWWDDTHCGCCGEPLEDDDTCAYGCDDEELTR